MGHFEECARKDCDSAMMCLDYQYGTFYFCPDCGTIQVTRDLKCGITRRMSRDSMHSLWLELGQKFIYKEDGE